MNSTAPQIEISLARQQLLLRAGGQILFEAPISSGLAGEGSEMGSGKTPLGMLRICSKHGENAHPHTLFRARLPQGLWPRDVAEGAAESILARILWLEGLEAGNANTKERYIYIHGTSDTPKLGSKASLGCIRLSPADAVRLYELAPLGTLVQISKD